ncbi:MAG: hypothetical protein ACT4RN_20145 [Pseudonocardia sp.]
MTGRARAALARLRAPSPLSPAWDGDVAPPRPPTGRLADLARAGFLGLPQPSMQVEFEIHHVVDEPGRLVTILDRPGETFTQTLSAGGNGVGLVVGTRVADVAAPGLARRAGAGSAVHLEPGASRAVCYGTARPNPTFQHDSAELFEAVICIEDEPRRITLRHGLAMRDALHEVTQVSVQERAPLLSLQSPAQIPPQASRRMTGGTPMRAVETSRSSSVALRFSMALARPRAAVRLRIADRLAAYCRAKGLGLWLADTRPGYQQGDWFIVARHERSAARAGYDPGPRRRVRGNTAEGCLPVTLVGPARLGSTHAVIELLAGFPDVGVLACAMTPLDELAFVHLQLAVNGASRGRLTAINRALAAWTDRPDGPAGILPHVLDELLGGTPGSDLDPRAVLAAAEDYQVVVGPALPVQSDSTEVRVPIWFTWQMPAAPDGPGLHVPVRSLAEAVDVVGLGPAGQPGTAPSIDHLTCRQSGPSRLLGKGKLSVCKAHLDAGFPPTRTDSSAARLCKSLERAWRTRLAADPDGAGITGVSVTSRESWLGHWT